MPRYWMINDRNNGGTGTDRNTAGLTYWVSDGGPLNNIANWQKLRNADAFKKLLAAATDAFPALPQSDNENQSHGSILVHGFNVSFDHSTSFYEHICAKLFDGPDSLGLCILYDWPSLGTVVGYEPDRAGACADDLTDILSQLYDWLRRNSSRRSIRRAIPTRLAKPKSRSLPTAWEITCCKKRWLTLGRERTSLCSPA
jgi:hypothetical protein